MSVASCARSLFYFSLFFFYKVEDVKACFQILGEAMFTVPPHPGGQGYRMGMPFPSNRSKSRHGDSAIL